MKDKLKKYIEDNLVKDNDNNGIFGTLFKSARARYVEEDVCEGASINNFIDNNKSDNKFQKLLFKYIDDRGLKDSDVYNKVHIDRRLFSKIRNDIDYHPSKDTVILLGISLELSIDELIELLNSASYSLPYNNHYDLIIRFCFIEGIYNLIDINELLSLYGCKLFNY